MDTGLAVALLLMAIIYSMLSVISGALLELSDSPQALLPWGAINVVLQPPEVHDLAESRVRWVLINCSSSSSGSSSSVLHQNKLGSEHEAPENENGNPAFDDSASMGLYSGSANFSARANSNFNSSVAGLGYLVTITSSDANIAQPYAADEWGGERRDNRTDRVVVLLTHNTVFAVQARNVGRAVFFIHVSALTTTTMDTTTMGDDDGIVLSVIEYPVTVVRKLRLVDLVFDCTMAAIALLNSFSLGCLTDWPSIRKYIYQPTALLLSSSCNFLLLPMASLAIVKAFGMADDIGLGLFYVACIPGGGGGLVMVAITQSGNRNLSIASNVLSAFIVVGMAPLWIFSLSHILGAAGDIRLHLIHLEIWLGASAGAYLLGIFARMCSEKVTEAYLNWFAKPFLLLFCILFVTLGVYINIYMFNILSVAAMIGGGLLPMLGYLLGLGVSSLGRLDNAYAQTVATECTVSNNLLALVVARFCLSAPGDDLAAAMPLWVVFTSPAPFLLACIARRLRTAIARRCQKRREKKYRHFSIVSGLLENNPAADMSAIVSATKLSPQPPVESEESDAVATANAVAGRLLVDEKVTVL